MRVLIDIAHPAHIHYFRNFAKEFKKRGHQCLFTLRDKGIIVELAKYYNLSYCIRSKEYGNKVKYILIAIKNVIKISKDFKPDLYMDAGTIVSAPVSKLFRKPYIALDDTEASVKARLLHMPFTDILLTPSAFYKEIGQKQIRFESLMEMFYLHENYFSKNIETIKPYIKNTNNYVLIRFVSWEAHHDHGKKGISFEKKVELINYLKGKYEIVISSEGKLADDFAEYRLKAPSHLIHDVIAHAKIVITEGATMASEAVILGTPTIYINPIQSGNSIEQENARLLTTLLNEENLITEIKKLEELLKNKRALVDFKLRHADYKSNKIDLTSFLVWFVENWPKSLKHVKYQPEFQKNFIK